MEIVNKYAALHAARLCPGDTITLAEAPFLHLFVPRGSVTLEGAGSLTAGDGRAAGHRHRTSRDPGMGDARHPRLAILGR
jgi:quercetin 2,3-dioxygenase